MVNGGGRGLPPGPPIPGSATGGPLSQKIGLELEIGSGLIRVRVGDSGFGDRDIGYSKPQLRSMQVAWLLSLYHRVSLMQSSGSEDTDASGSTTPNSESLALTDVFAYIEDTNCCG